MLQFGTNSRRFPDQLTLRDRTTLLHGEKDGMLRRCELGVGDERIAARPLSAVSKRFKE
jgi:hypothetical protein